MRPPVKRDVVLFLVLLTIITGCATTQEVAIGPPEPSVSTDIMINVDAILADVSRDPIGINVNCYMDSDFFSPKRSTVDALKAMGVKWLRYPGGEKSDLYLWSVPPYDKPVPTMARTGEGCVTDRSYVLDNSSTFKHDVLDFDEFVRMCREVGAEPVIVVAADGYLTDYPKHCTFTDRETLIETAAAWVRYANITKGYNIKYWMIGNETWHTENENSTPEIYAQDVIDFSKAMKAADPSIKVIPNGDSYEWWETVLPAAVDYVDSVCLSNYPLWNYKEGYKTYRDSAPDLIGRVYATARAIEKFVPDERKKEFKIIVAEYGPFDWSGTWPHINDMGHAMANFDIAGQQLNHPKVQCSLLWNTRWIWTLDNENQIWDAMDKQGNFNATGHTIAIWGNFLSSKMVYTTSTIRIRTFASYDAAKKQLYLYIINKSEGKEALVLDIEGASVDSVAQRWELVGKDDSDTDPLWQKNESTSASEALSLSVPGTSITVIEYKLK
jgi:alpha-L-arabinofuranosidase